MSSEDSVIIDEGLYCFVLSAQKRLVLLLWECASNISYIGNEQNKLQLSLFI